MKPALPLRLSVAVVLYLALPACTPGMFSLGGLQVFPSSTTVSVDQGLSFQVTGGTPPYQFQVSGVGMIDPNGNYQAGSTPGQAQVQVVDTNNNTGTATVSVVQSASNGYPNQPYSNQYRMSRKDARPLRGWSASTTPDPRKPIVNGPVLAMDERNLDSGGDEIRSKFVETSLRHPLVRVDTLIENKSVVATRAIVEDQFLVTLRDGSSEGDLLAVLDQAGAHVSQRVTDDGTYLVSLDRGAGSAGAPVTGDLISRRARLKRMLLGVGAVLPNYLTRDPASLSRN
jgi:hypothetical protein